MPDNRVAPSPPVQHDANLAPIGTAPRCRGRSMPTSVSPPTIGNGALFSSNCHMASFFLWVQNNQMGRVAPSSSMSAMGIEQCNQGRHVICLRIELRNRATRERVRGLSIAGVPPADQAIQRRPRESTLERRCRSRQ